MTRDARSYTRRLRLLGLTSALTTVAVLAGVLLGSKGASMPGSLTVNHASLAENCDACHAKGLGAIQSVWHGLETTAVDLQMSASCRACHQLGADALAPHGRHEYGASDDAQEALACNACHQEHGGRFAELTAIQGAACQSCHAEPFASFESGHPELTDYPYERRTQLVFDHAAHVARHFQGAQAQLAPTSCTDCHAADPAGERMLVRGFEQACAACHGAEIRGVTQVEAAGLAFLGLPALDTFTLAERGVAIGHWPADSMLTESELTPFMRLLLTTPEGEADLSLFAELDLLDLTAAEDEELAAVARVAWRIKALFAELVAGGHQALVVRLGAALQHELEPDLAAAMLEGLPEGLLRGALRTWQPELQAELLAQRAGDPPATTSEPSVEVDQDRDRGHETWVQTGGWYLNELDFLVRYRPAGHADLFLRAWLDASGTSDRGSDLFARLSSSSSVGSCTKCHAVEELGDASVVRWSETAREPDTLTRFSHVEHFASPEANACVACHELAADDGTYLGAFEQPEQHDQHELGHFTPNFAALSLDTCLDCHGPAGASVACTSCHAYHAAAPSRALPRASLEGVVPKAASD